MRGNRIVGGKFQADGDGAAFDGSPESTAIWAPAGNIGRRGTRLRVVQGRHHMRRLRRSRAADEDERSDRSEHRHSKCVDMSISFATILAAHATAGLRRNGSF